MIQNAYIYEKLVQGHRQDLLHEAQQRRMVENLTHHTDNLRGSFAGKLMTSGHTRHELKE